jgi:hypothetical protein
MHRPDRFRRHRILVRTTFTIPYETGAQFLFFSHSIEIVLHSILACRLVIGIREATRSVARKSQTFELTGTPGDDSVVFARTGGHSVSNGVDLEALVEPPRP